MCYTYMGTILAYRLLINLLDIHQVGIIMYLPTTDEKQREAITHSFFDYRKSTQHQLWDTYGAHEHWAKIEVSNDLTCWFCICQH
jgi:hypothetical protein